MKNEITPRTTGASIIKWHKEMPKNLEYAIAKNCLDCIGYPDAGYREEIKNCTAGDDCALWEHRPYND